MGDASDAGVLILFVPLLLAPVFAIAKGLFSRVLFSRINALAWRQIAIVAIAESFLPLATLLAYFPFLIMVRLAAPSLLEERWFRISGFLFFLYLANGAANYVLLECGIMGRLVAKRRAAAARSLIQGLLPTLIFVAAWMILGKLLVVNG